MLDRAQVVDTQEISSRISQARPSRQAINLTEDSVILVEESW